MKTYPMFARLEGRACLVVGGGAVAERKVKDLLLAGAQVTVVSPNFTSTLMELAARGEIQLRHEPFRAAQITGQTLVIGATNDPEVNARVSAVARGQGIWVNIVDAPELCSFIVPAQVRRRDLTVAIGTGGASPALARRLRQDLEDYLDSGYGRYLEILQAVRERLLAVRRGHADNAELFRRLVDSPLKEALAEPDLQQARAILQEILGEVLDASSLTALLPKT
jgi:precorrin-2 dehydrogenase/sirohydrochlorin ferrochelatase